MRWARIEVDGMPRVGIVEADRVELVEGGIFDGGARTGETVTLDQARFLVPLEPKTFYAAGLNYAEHVMEQARANNREPNLPPKPDIGLFFADFGARTMIGDAPYLTQSMELTGVRRSPNAIKGTLELELQRVIYN